MTFKPKCCIAAAALAGMAVPAAASVSPKPASRTPQLASTGTTEMVRQLVRCGNTMFAVGRFTAIEWNGRRYKRHNVFSFKATAPYAVTRWNPDANGEVNSITFNGSNCATAYVGGAFTSVHGTPARNIARLSTSSGAVRSGFRHDANAAVETLAAHRGHLLVGGFFTAINGSRRAYMASLRLSTGADDGFVNLRIHGNYRYCAAHSCAGNNNPTRVYNQQISHGGSLDLVEGDFTSVGGRSRQQIFMLGIGGARARVTAWTSRGFFGHCAVVEPFYVRAASWSPDDRTVYVADTGYRPVPYTGLPLKGLCDAAAAFPAKQTTVSRKWVNHTGCDSLYSTVAGTSTAYFGGHERWSENPRGCDRPGPGAISAPGMEGLSPRTGRLTFNPTRARGIGADDMLLTGAGLWIASDNSAGGMCGGRPNHAGICLLPRR